MDLSIVIPAYNEEAKIGRDIQAATALLRNHNLDGEIIVVDDGSTDATSETARSIEVSLPCRVERFDINRGKGHAVRHGVLSSRGKAILFMDCGVCVPLECCLDILPDLQAGRCHLALGSRHHPDSQILQDQTPYRKFCSTAFRWLVRRMLPQLAPYHDTQCGFKLYHGPIARDLFGRSHIDGFMFDIEILCLALQRNLQVQEFPLTWTCDRDSRLSPGRSLTTILKDLRKIRSNFLKAH